MTDKRTEFVKPERQYTPDNRHCYLALGDEMAGVGKTREEASADLFDREGESWAESYAEKFEHNGMDKDKAWEEGMKVAESHQPEEISEAVWANVVDLFDRHEIVRISEAIYEAASEEMDDEHYSNSNELENQVDIYFGKTDEEHRELARRIRRTIRDYAKERGFDPTNAPIPAILTKEIRDNIDDLSPWSLDVFDSVREAQKITFKTIGFAIHRNENTRYTWASLETGVNKFKEQWTSVIAQIVKESEDVPMGDLLKDMPDHILHRFAVDCARRSMQRMLDVGIEIPRESLEAPQAKEYWIRGAISDSCLEKAEEEADRFLSHFSGSTPERHAVWSAWNSAKSNAFDSSFWASDWAVDSSEDRKEEERSWQRNRLAELILEIGLEPMPRDVK